VPVAAADHAGQPAATGTPVGLLPPASGERVLGAVSCRVTRAGPAECPTRWWGRGRERCAHIATRVRQLDNGPGKHSRRTQFMPRPVACATRYGLRVPPASDPPYHSRDHPLERCWGILEQPWHGSRLGSGAAVPGFAATMTWHGRRPSGEPVATADQRGVRRTAAERAVVEAQLARRPGLERWFAHIDGPARAGRDA
jgi:hypothetical protein